MTSCPGRLLTLIVVTAVTATPAVSAEPAALESAILSIRKPDLSRHVSTLASDSLRGRAAGTDGGRAAGNYLVQQLRRLGLQPAGQEGDFYQEFSEQGYRNVLALLPGRDPVLKHEYVVVGAHYDHVGLGTKKTSRGPLGQIHNGADDNASGTAALLEIAEALVAMKQDRPRRSVLLAFWDAEELGMLGSRHWMRSPTISLEKIRIAVNVDMIGRLRKNRLILYGSRTGTGFRSFVSRLNSPARCSLDLDFNWDLIPNSDHITFYRQSVPILFFHTGLHEDYHRPGDDADKLNLDGLQTITRLLLRLAHAASVDEALPGFRGASSKESEALRKRIEQPSVARVERLGVAWDPELAKQGIVKLIEVTDDSAADDARLRKGDRLLKVGDWTIDRPERLPLAIMTAPSHVTLLVDRRRRKGQKLVSVELPGRPRRLGIDWEQDDAEPGRVVLRKVVHGSPADKAGLAAGDRIDRVGSHTFGDGESFGRLVVGGQSELVFRVERLGRLRTVRVMPLSATVQGKPPASR